MGSHHQHQRVIKLAVLTVAVVARAPDAARSTARRRSPETCRRPSAAQATVTTIRAGPPPMHGKVSGA
jgi:hypothetical protein